MKKIEAIIRKTKFEDVKDALLEADIEWFSYYDVRGIGKSAEPLCICQSRHVPYRKTARRFLPTEAGRYLPVSFPAPVCLPDLLCIEGLPKD